MNAKKVIAAVHQRSDDQVHRLIPSIQTAAHNLSCDLWENEGIRTDEAMLFRAIARGVAFRLEAIAKGEIPHITPSVIIETTPREMLESFL